MSEIIDYKTKEYTIHHIYCNDCGRFICDSEEYDDGYYYDPSEYEQKICINSEWYSLRKNICKECANKTDIRLVNIIKSFGFVKGF